jgi:hypothetical protein
MKAGQTGPCAAPMEAGSAEECPVSRRAVNALAILGTNIDSPPSLREPWGMAHSATYFAGGGRVLQAAVYVETLSLAVEALIGGPAQRGQLSARSADRSSRS